MNHPKIQTDRHGTLWLNFGNYGEEVEVACFSSDGRRLLTVQEVGVARIWDVNSRLRIGEVRPTSPLAGSDAGPTTLPFEVYVEAAALDPEGALALLGLNDGTAGLFSIEGGERRTTFHHLDRPPAQKWELIRAVNFSSDGSLAAVGFLGRCVGVWEVFTGRLVAFLRCDLGERLHRPNGWIRDTLVSSVAFSLDNSFVFAGHADMTATLWELGTGKAVFEAYEHQETILTVGQHEGRVRWATSGGSTWAGSPAGSCLQLRTGESWAEAAFAPDGESLLVRTAEGLVQRWHAKGGPEILADLGPEFDLPDHACSVGFCPGGQALFHPLSDSRLALVSESHTAELALQPGNDKSTISRAGDHLALHGQNRLRLWAVPSGELLCEMADGNGFWTVALSPDGSLLAAGTLGQVTARDLGPPRTISLWSLPTGRRLCRWPAHDHQIHALTFLPDGRHLASASLDHTVRLWRLADSGKGTPTEVGRIHHEDLRHEHLHALGDGRLLVFRDVGVEVWRDLREKLLEFPATVGSDDPWLVSAGGRQLVLAKECRVEVWCLETGRLLARHAADIPRPEIVPDGKLTQARPFTAGGCLWRTRAGNFIHVSDGPRGWATPLRLSPEGRYIVLPCKESAALISLDGELQIVQEFPFAGRLRASCITPERVLAVDSTGRVCQAMRTPSVEGKRIP